LICEHETAYGQTPGGTQGNIMGKPIFGLAGRVERNKINADHVQKETWWLQAPHESLSAP
ncbi:MAG: hypothetical protein ACRCZO_10255, partial [Cetobacterium sp.]